MNNLCIIPMRSGSKRVPRKNFRLFHGKPIYQYSIDTAMRTPVFDEIVCAIDTGIQEEDYLFIQSKVTPYMRSIETSSDTATLGDLTREVLQQYPARDTVTVLYATAPFVMPDDLMYMIFDYHKRGCQCVYSMDRDGKPNGQAFVIDPYFKGEIMSRINHGVYTCGIDIDTEEDWNRAVAIWQERS